MNRKRLEAWFQKYDTDASGLLESSELRLLLIDVMPNQPPPTDEAVAALLAVFPSGIGVDEIMRATLRYEAYVKDKKRLDDAFAALCVPCSQANPHTQPPVAVRLDRFTDTASLAVRGRDLDGSGLLEKMELARVMGDLVPQLPEIAEEDLNFVYDRMRSTDADRELSPFSVANDKAPNVVDMDCCATSALSSNDSIRFVDLGSCDKASTLSW